MQTPLFQFIFDNFEYLDWNTFVFVDVFVNFKVWDPKTFVTIDILLISIISMPTPL